MGGAPPDDQMVLGLMRKAALAVALGMAAVAIADAPLGGSVVAGGPCFEVKVLEEQHTVCIVWRAWLCTKEWVDCE